MRVAYRVQHAVGRDVQERLLSRLPGCEVVTDLLAEDSNPYRGYLGCLRDPPSDATHLLVIQDDALPCPNFAAAVERAVDEKPDEIVSFFVGGLTNRTRRDFYLAQQAGKPWVPVYFSDIHHVVCLVWPVGLAASFLEWAAVTKIPGAQPPRSDDAAVGFWARTTHRRVWATVPCLVEHPDDVKSFVRDDAQRGDKGRRAISFIGDGDLFLPDLIVDASDARVQLSPTG